MNGHKTNGLEDVEEQPLKSCFRLNGNQYAEQDEYTGK